MDWSRLLDLASTTWSRAKAFIVANTEIAGAAMVVAALVAALLVWRSLHAGAKGVGAIRRAAQSARVRKSGDVGARILVARGRTLREQALCRFMDQSLGRHIKEFMFGGPFQIMSYPDTVRTEQRAQSLLARSEADILVWADTVKGEPSSVRISSRSTNPTEPGTSSQILAMPRSRSEWSDSLALGMAYAAAKQYRPALGRPQDFRPERLKPVVEILLNILESQPKADPRLMAELVDDAASGALQLAASGEVDWLDRAVDFTRGTLDGINRSAAPDRWISAKVNLGRALRLRAERRFDPVVLREATGHLQEALEALRSESRFRLAESAAQAIADAQKLLSGRRKFSITGGGV